MIEGLEFNVRKLSLKQMDMHELIEDQMKKQLSDNMPKRKSATISASTPITKKAASRFMGLFQR